MTHQDHPVPGPGTIRKIIAVAPIFLGEGRLSNVVKNSMKKKAPVKTKILPLLKLPP